MTGFLQDPLYAVVIPIAGTLVIAVLLLGSAPFWWRPLSEWRWRRGVKRLPDYVRSRAERYVGAARTFDIDDRVKMRNELCRDMALL